MHSKWKRASITPIAKFGKLDYQGTIYRSITLLVLERLPKLKQHLTLADSKHELRIQKFFMPALLPPAHKVAVGFKPQKPQKDWADGF